LVAAVGLKSRYADTRRHFDPLQHIAGLRIDPPHIALVAFPCAVPKLAIDPGNAGDEAVGFDGAQDRARGWIDLMDLAVPIRADPKRAFGPGEAGVAAPPGAGMVATTRSVFGSIL
jgi:hypothetical protein